MNIILTIAVACLLAMTPLAHADFVDTFDGYPKNADNWDGSYPYNHTVPWVKALSGTSRIREDVSIAGITSPKLVVQANEAWYSRTITIPENATRVTMTASMGLTHPTLGEDGALHGTWPRANHIILGNVAIGISGSQISYLLWDGTVGGSILETTVTKVVGIDYNKWYTVKIDWNIVPGENNDTADLYYKLEGESEYTPLVLGLKTGVDLTSTIYIAQWAGYNTNRGAIDNATLTTVIPEPSAMGLLGSSGVLVFARRQRMHDRQI